MSKKSVELGFGKIADIHERRSARRSIGASETHSFLGGSNEWRFHYTIKSAVEHSEFWWAYDPDEQLILAKWQDRWVAPFWPHEDIAVRACHQMGLDCDIDPMPLDHWIDEVLDGSCRTDDCLIALCPSHGDAELKSVDDVLKELAKYRIEPEAYWEQHFADDQVFITQNMRAGPKGKLP